MDIGEVGEASGEERVREAGDTGAFAEVGFLVLFQLKSVRLVCSSIDLPFFEMERVNSMTLSTYHFR